MTPSTIPPSDQSLFFYGSLYHRLLDPQIADERRVAVDLVPQGSTVLDIGCGTGQLCRELAEHKNCCVLGVDLSLRMLAFAQAANTGPGLTFMHLDATDLHDIDDDAFDLATVVLLVHELPLEGRMRMLHEALRVSSAVLIIDAAAPLPHNLAGLGVRAVEHTFGQPHVHHFTDFIKRGGVGGLVTACGFADMVARRDVFWHGCREAVVLRRAARHALDSLA